MERRTCLRVIASGLALGTAACAATRQALRDRPEGRWMMAEYERYAAEFERYAKKGDQLRRNHASGPLDEKAIRDFLRTIGVTSAPTRPTPGSPPSAARPFPVATYAGAYRWPLNAGLVTAEFGQRRGFQHAGLDIAADTGAPVFASAPGEVVYAGDQLGGYGNAVIVRHDYSTSTLYGHNSALKVKTGAKVLPDQVVALVGSTGRSTGPHLHFEIRDFDKPVDPRLRLPKSRF
jgi:murein DD-endopeptidase MepM/ murein hydrolase activator NlpD